jgi:antirestriction protein
VDYLKVFKMTKAVSSLKPEVYIVDLAAYTNGLDNSGWFDATLEPLELKHRIDEMIGRSPIPEAQDWAVHDGRDMYDLVREFSSVEQISTIGKFLDRYGDLGGKVADYYCCTCIDNLGDAIDALEERYLGCYRSLTDYVEEYCKEMYQIPKALSGYINWERIAHDLECGDRIFTIQVGDNVHVFDTGTWSRKIWLVSS